MPSNGCPTTDKKREEMGGNTPISTSADFGVLLRASIEDEGQCGEQFHYDKYSPEHASSSGAATPYCAASGGSKRVGEPLEPPRKKSRQHVKRSRLRDADIKAVGYRLSKKLAEKRLDNVEPIHTSVDASQFPVAHGAYTALNKPAPSNPDDNPDISTFMAQHPDFTYVKASATARPIVDRNGLIIGVIAPPPTTSAYTYDIEHLLQIILDESSSHAFSSVELHHKRGSFPAVNFGFTLPNGFKDPINLDHKRHAEKIRRIRESPGFESICNSQNAILSFWHPGMYDYQKRSIEQVLAGNPHLKRTVPKTIFPTTAVNFGKVCCAKHRDTQNCPFGWCGITALGRFDHSKGGHLIMWELKLIFEFPHGYSALIPSATITHSNTPTADGDTRVSVTQYCAGSLLRYADNLFCTDKALREKNMELYNQNQQNKGRRWENALHLYSTIDSLKRGKRPNIPLFS